MKIGIDKKNSEKIRAIGFVCALMVVAIHCTAIPKDWWNGTLDMPKWIISLQAFGSDTVARLAVPWFFVISGFFLVKNLCISRDLEFSSMVREIFSWWKKTVGKRFLTLGVPYLLWNLIYYGFKVATGKYGFDGWHCLKQLTGYDLYEVPACGQFWYVRCVLMYVVFSPVFIVIMGLRHVGIAVIVALLVCWFAGVWFPIPYMQLTDVQYILFFGTGIYLGMRKDFGAPIKREIYAGLACIFSISVLSVLYGAVTRDATLTGVSTKIMIATGLPTLWAAGDRIVALTERWKHLYGLAFFVYALHVILVSLAYKITVKMMTPVMFQTMGYLLKVAVGIIGSLIVGRVLARFAPRLLNVLCGGRA